MTISNFSAPAPVPEPSTVLSLLVLGGLGAGLKYLKRN
ncbi:MAG: PEP-CTERM sorting domain-containing protein [Microcystis sp. LE19-10.1B]|nr:PEP-CTERM sorting domain-containing protein [Microcystis sp. LE19-10.1B]MCZ8027320.1 PEP-CTERM sorting domain-containing protein [Microcystis sp. LE19-10.1B]MDJ0543568.1 PEP-CTERM sorting domain-containing protein [Microcystis sp. M53601_WE4]